MPSTLFWLAFFLLLALGSKHIFGPILVHSRSSVSAHPSFNIIPAEHAEALFPASFFSTIYELEAQGFSLVCHLSSASDAPRIHTVISLLSNRVSQTSATIVSMAMLAPELARISTAYLEFTTEFADGSEINTMNSASIRVFYDVPQEVVIRVPHVKDPGTLYRIHLHSIGKRARDSRVLPESGREVEQLCESIKKSLAQQTELGFYFFDEANQRFRPTWRGASRGTWRL